MGLIGAHVSIAGRISRSVERAMEIGCESFQIFSRNQRQWYPPPLSRESAMEFRSYLSGSDLGPVMVHGSYLMNPASSSGPIRKKTMETLVDELNRCELLGIDRLVIHPGSHLGKGIEEGMEKISSVIDSALEDSVGNSRVLLETTSGHGTSIGCRPEELSGIISRSEYEDRLGLCLDTCHLHAAGYDLTDREAYCGFLEDLESMIGIEKVDGIHLNDSVGELGSKKDRHAGIGKGTMGTNVFSFLMNEKRFRDVPMILETPGGPNVYEQELSFLRSLRDA